MFMLSNSAVSFACLEFVAKTSNYATKSETIFRGISPRFDKKSSTVLWSILFSADRQYIIEWTVQRHSVEIITRLALNLSFDDQLWKPRLWGLQLFIS